MRLAIVAATGGIGRHLSGLGARTKFETGVAERGTSALVEAA